MGIPDAQRPVSSEPSAVGEAPPSSAGPSATEEAVPLVPLSCLLLTALAYRVAAVASFPVVFDEVQVMAYGLARALADPWALVFEIPVTVSNGITPLWYWAQALPAWLFGETTKLGLRTLPLLLGMLGVWLCCRAGARLHGRRGALLAGLLYGLQGPLVVVNARGEFAESLLAPLSLLLLLDLLPRPGGGPVPLRAALWPALALFTYLGKGLVLWGAFVAFLGCLLLLGRRGRAARDRIDLRRAALLALLPLLPSVAWLLAAQGALFRGGGTVVTDLGPAASVWESVFRLTLGYGSGPTSFMAAGWREALFVYTDFTVWPSLSLLAVPSAAVLLRLAWRLARGIAGRDGEETERALLPLSLIGAPLCVLLAKGALDVRFHLLHLAILLPYLASALLDWFQLLEGPRSWLFVVLGIAECAYVAWTASWVDRQAALLSWSRWALGTSAGVAVLLAFLGLARGRGLRTRRDQVGFALIATTLMLSQVLAGPLVWGRRWAWEPSPLPDDRPREVTDFPNADLQLALCFLARDGTQRARPFLLRALDRHPDDPATVTRVSESLLQERGQDVTTLIGRLSEYLRRHPEDPDARRLLEKALARAQGG